MTNSRQAILTPARTLASTLALVLLTIIVGAATQSATLGVILFLAMPVLVLVNLQVAWKHRARRRQAGRVTVTMGRPVPYQPRPLHALSRGRAFVVDPAGSVAAR